MITKRWLGGLIFSIFMASLSCFSYAAPVKITNIQISDTASQTQIIIKLSTLSQPHVFALTHPDRLVFDFPNTQLAVRLKSLYFTHANITTIRSGQSQPAVFRLVFDLGHPFYFKKINKLPAQQIIVTVSALADQVKKNKSVVKKEVFHSQGIANLNKDILKNAMPALSTHHVMVVIIDPGHGGKDTGAIGHSGVEEKEVVLSIAKQLADLINQEPTMRAVLTRNGDYYVTLHNRLVYARKNKADIYISIHADSYFNHWASGASVYALSKNGASSIAARWLARRDNYSELGGVELRELGDQSSLLRSVLIDLAQTVTVTDSLRLGTALLDQMNNVTLLHYSRVEQAPFMVLKSPDIPSVLVETGFISNPGEELRLRDKRYQHKIAISLFNGVRYYQKKYAVAGL